MRISEYILVVDISFKISLKLSVRLSISPFCLRVFGFEKLKLIFIPSYNSWEIFVLSLSSNLLFTRNRSSVLMFQQTTLCNKTLNSSCEIPCFLVLTSVAVRYRKVFFCAVFYEFTGTIVNRFLTNPNARSISYLRSTLMY